MTSPAAQPRVLVVDDQPLNIRMLHLLLTPRCQVFMATSGAQALEVCRRQQPDLVLLDVVMPEMDGYETCRRLRADALCAGTRVVFVSGHDTDSERERGLDAGALDFLTKPVEPQALLALLDRLGL